MRGDLTRFVGKANARMPVDLPDDAVVFDFTSGFDRAAVEDATYGIGRYDEPRPHGMYTSDIYEDGRHIHMGIDLWAPAGTPVHSPLDGQIVAVQHHDNHRDYGPTIVTEHRISDRSIYLLFGHLALSSLGNWKKGDRVERGEVIGHLGDPSENGDWPPHLHLQLSRSTPEEGNLPGVVTADERVRARYLYPDPRILLGPIY